MQVTLEDLPGLERKLNVTVPADRVKSAVESKLQEIAGKAKLPGFRPGKVPFEVIRKNYGKSAHSQVLENLVRDTYPEAIQKENLNPVAPPNIQVVSADPEGHFVYNATFEVYPEVKLVDFEKINIDRSTSKVEEEDLNEMLEKMRKTHIKWEDVTDPARKSQAGDQLTVDFAVKPSDQDIEPKTEKGVKFSLGDGNMWDDFEKPLYDMGPGEEKAYTLEMPDTHMDKSLAGKKADFKVKVHKVSSPILPELNDEFAAKMNIKEGGLEKLKDEVRTQMEREVDQVLRGLFKQDVMNKLLELNVLEVPKVLIEHELNRLAQNWNKRLESQGNLPGKKPEFPRGEFEPQAKRNVTLGLLLSAIVKEHKITVTPAEVRKKIEGLVSAYYEDKKDMVEKCLADKSYSREIESLLLEEKVIEHLASQINIIDKTISYKEAMEKKQNA